MTDIVTVAEIDRIAYLKLKNMPPEDSQGVMAGEWDDVTGMQVLARNRIAAEQRGILAERERCLAIIAGDRWADFFDGSKEQEELKQELSQAIRNAKEAKDG